MMEQKSSLDQTSSESFFFFNPRTPCGVRHDSEMTLSYFTLFQSTHSLRSATIATGIIYLLHHVSIHALLAECDGVHTNIVRLCTGFNPRTPCGVRQFTCSASNTQKKFQSTHSLRSATAFHSVFCSIFNVSIHALLAECDLEPSHNSTKTKRFNPRTPCGVRPLDSFGIVIVPRGFNPRTPCGVRPIINGDNPPGTVFQSTHSLRSATQLPIPPLSTPPVSIHALLAECDTRLLFCIICIMRFNSRTPCGVRQ